MFSMNLDDMNKLFKESDLSYVIGLDIEKHKIATFLTDDPDRAKFDQPDWDFPKERVFKLSEIVYMPIWLHKQGMEVCEASFCFSRSFEEILKTLVMRGF